MPVINPVVTPSGGNQLVSPAGSNAIVVFTADPDAGLGIRFYREFGNVRVTRNAPHTTRFGLPQISARFSQPPLPPVFQMVRSSGNDRVVKNPPHTKFIFSTAAARPQPAPLTPIRGITNGGNDRVAKNPPHTLKINPNPQRAPRFVPTATPKFMPVMRPKPRPGARAQRTIFIRPNMIDYARRYSAGRGLYRIFNAIQYRFYRSSVGPPAETDTPFATSSSLPNQPAVAFGNATWYLSVSYFNGIMDSGFLPLGPRGETYLVLEVSGGAALGTRPGLPGNFLLSLRPGGVVRVNAFYFAAPDRTNRATDWALTYTTNGSTPATDTPTIVQSMSTGALSVLSYDLPAQANGTTVKVRLQTRRGSGPYVYSLPGSVLSIVADATGPTAPLALQDWAGALPEDL